MSNIPIVKANTVIKDYGINSTGKEFQYEGKKCVVGLACHPKYELAILEKTGEISSPVVAYIEFE
jgi:hypothetical protein